MSNLRPCWCGSSTLLPFSPKYSRCNSCGSLVSTESLSDDQLVVQDDETDFYGKQYWLRHQQSDLGFPDIYLRSRSDLRERNLHWLKALLKYSLPSAKVLELGCSHGSFVGLMSQAGYQAMGVEMSPWVVDFGRQNFEVPIYVGPVEQLDIAPKSLDVIALMDVLEHLPEPVTTISHCLNLLKPDGFLLIQTPEFHEDMQYEILEKKNSPFLMQLKADEHLHLFSRKSVSAMLKQVGIQHIYFEPAIFSHYDMFFVASKTALNAYTVDEAATALQATLNGRITLALLDIRENELEQIQKLKACEEDRAARLENIHILTDKIYSLTSQLEKARASNLQLQEDVANKLEKAQSIASSAQSEPAKVEFDPKTSRFNAQLSIFFNQASSRITQFLNRITKK